MEESEPNPSKLKQRGESIFAESPVSTVTVADSPRFELKLTASGVNGFSELEAILQNYTLA